MLTRLYVHNYRTMVNFEIKLQPLCLLLGRNGTGKSSVIDVLAVVRNLLRGDTKILHRDSLPTRSLCRLIHQETQVIEIDASLHQGRFQYRLVVEHQPDARRARISQETLHLNERCIFSFENSLVTLFRDDFSQGPQFRSDWTESALANVIESKDNTALIQFRDFVTNMTVCRLNPTQYLTEANEEASSLALNGANLGAWLWFQQLEHPDRNRNIAASLKQAFPYMSGFKFEKTGLESRALAVRQTINGSDHTYLLDELSDGQKALLTLYALLEALSDSGGTLVIDEPENHLAISEIQPWLAFISQQCEREGRQVIIASHHPEVIDYLGPSSIIMLGRDTSGLTRTSSLVYSKEHDGLKLSELMASGWDWPDGRHNSSSLRRQEA